MIKLGAVNLDVSHPLSFTWAIEAIQKERPFDMKYVAVYNDGFRTPEEVEFFANKYGVKICSTLDELASLVDVAMIHSCDWDRHLELAVPFIEKGVPVFIDKPIVGNYEDIVRLKGLAEAGAKIIGTSALRYCYEVKNAKLKMQELNTRPLFSHATVGGDGFSYFIHAVEHILALYKSKPISCKLISSVKGDGSDVDTYLIRFDDGAQASFTTYENKGVPFSNLVITETKQGGSDFCYTVDNAKLYVSLMESLKDYVEGDTSAFATVDEMCDGILIMLAGKISKETFGIEVPLDSPLIKSASYSGIDYYNDYKLRASKTLYKG